MFFCVFLFFLFGFLFILFYTSDGCATPTTHCRRSPYLVKVGWLVSEYVGKVHGRHSDGAGRDADPLGTTKLKHDRFRTGQRTEDDGEKKTKKKKKKKEKEKTGRRKETYHNSVYHSMVDNGCFVPPRPLPRQRHIFPQLRIHCAVIKTEGRKKRRKKKARSPRTREESSAASFARNIGLNHTPNR